MPGPAPKPASQRRRQNTTAPVVQLPAEGRSGPPPEWPIGRAKAGELKIWREIWATPHAVAWERLGWARTVARYVRMLTEAEKPGAVAFLLAEVRHLESEIGLTPKSMLALRWEIVADEVAERREESESSVISRLRPVVNDAVART